MKRRAICALITPAMMISGCASGPLDQSWPEMRPLGRSLVAEHPPRLPDDVVAIDIYQEPTGKLSLRDALAAALLRSPDLAATGYEVRVREAEALQAGLLPNPELDVELENFAGTGGFSGSDTLETTLALSQLIELGGKRVKRRRVADSGSRIAGWEYEIRRIDVLSKTATDYVGLLAAERRLRIAIETLDLAQRVFEVVGLRVDAGKVSPVERTKARIELAQAELGRNQARREVISARFRLASNWGSITPQFESPSGDLDQTESPPTLEALTTRVARNPDIARWAAEVALRQAEVELALAQRIPDLTVAGGVRHFNEIDETAFVAGLSIPLPVFDQNQGGILAARLRVLQSGRIEEANRIQIHIALVAAYQILDASFVSVNTTREQILPNAVIAFEASEEAFRLGKIGALDLLDSERTLFEARKQLTDFLTTYHLAVIAVERLIGAPLHEDTQPQGPE